jgi:hypothetical protein
MRGRSEIWIRSGFALASGLLATISIIGSAAAATYTINTSVTGPSLGAIKGVPVTVSGVTLPAPVTIVTNTLGKAKFPGLAAGAYTVTPARDGWAYLPESRTITVGGTKLKYPAAFLAKKLKPVGTIVADPGVLTLPASVGTALSKGVVIVSVKDAVGNPIYGAPLQITVPAGVTVTPSASVKTNTFGQVLYTVTAGKGAAAGSAIFQTGGWRGTAAKTATTALTVSPPIPEAYGWSLSGHADAESAAFNHWNEEGTIPVSCAKCHATPGFRDFLGADGTAGGVVNNPAPTGTVIECTACHNSAAPSLDSVTFPSGEVADDLGSEAVCLVCHQGTLSMLEVDAALGSLGPDEVDTTITFTSTNIHYLPAGVAQYGGQAKGGYQYDPGYGRKFDHVRGVDTCVDCHDSHSGQVKIEVCQGCHSVVNDVDDTRLIRMQASYLDYDGDGDTGEGIAGEVDGLADVLYGLIQGYAGFVTGTHIVYSAAAYPYYFIDTNENGLTDPAETVFSNQFRSWSPRLLKAAYNYHFYRKDPGAYAHNPKYFIQLFRDGIVQLGTIVGFGGTIFGNDGTHFNVAQDAFRVWDGTGIVPPACARCHSGEEGFDAYLRSGYVDAPTGRETVNRMSCGVCHAGFTTTTAPRKYVSQVIFPGGTTLHNSTTNPDASFLCMTCHQGMTSTATINASIQGKPLDDIDTTLALASLHRGAAGGAMYGTTAKVAYEFAGLTYQDVFRHANPSTPARCQSCHTIDPLRHDFSVKVTTGTCMDCHDEAAEGDPQSIRKNRPVDYNGNGDTAESLKSELNTLADVLWARIQTVAAANGYGIDYNMGAPWFCEIGTYTLYSHWTPRLLRASFNYHSYVIGWGGWAHNTDYFAQILYDSIVDLGGDVTGFNVPGRTP